MSTFHFFNCSLLLERGLRIETVLTFGVPPSDTLLSSSSHAHYGIVRIGNTSGSVAVARAVPSAVRLGSKLGRSYRLPTL